MKKIGIFSGTFDPIHNGHISFALNTVSKKRLDEVIFLPERQPRHKKGVSDFKQRLEMLRLATKPHKQLEVFELPDTQFSVSKTMPKLQKKFKGAELYFLFGSDVAAKIPTWPGAEELGNVIVALRGSSGNPDSQITGTAIRHGGLNNAVPKSVQTYIKQHNLYQ